MFYNNIEKIKKKNELVNLLKTCIQTTYPIDFCIIWSKF